MEIIASKSEYYNLREIYMLIIVREILKMGVKNQLVSLCLKSKFSVKLKRGMVVATVWERSPVR